MIFEKNYLKSVLLNEKLFKDILLKAETLDLIYLSFNNTLSVEMINKLFEKKIENVNINLLKNSLCEEKKLLEFLKLNDKIYNITIAHNKNLSKKIYKHLENINDEDVQTSLFLTHKK